jgi:hypothetical protein
LQEWINVYEVDEDLLLPMFGVIKQILNCVWIYILWVRSTWNIVRFQAYHVKETEAMETGIVSYESLVDFKVFHTLRTAKVDFMFLWNTTLAM